MGVAIEVREIGPVTAGASFASRVCFHVLLSPSNECMC